MSDFETYQPSPLGTDAKFVRRPIWICDWETGRFVWANGDAISFWAAQSLEQLQSRTMPPSHPAWQEIAQAFSIQEPPLRLTLTFPEQGEDVRYHTLCRLGCLKERKAVVIEIISVLSEKADNGYDSDRGARPLNGAVIAPDSSSQVHPPSSPPAPPEALQNLASLIEQARADEDDPALDDAVAVEGRIDVDSRNAASPPAKEAEAVWENLSLDFTALKGVGDDDEIEALFSACPQPVALVYSQRILHANGAFVAAFGYGDITSLGNDGTDWILPQSRPRLRPFYEQGREEPLVLNNIRLCSGRSLARSVYVTPVRLVKFDRVFLLITLDEANHDLPLAAASQQTGLDPTSLMSFIGHEVRNPLNIIHGFAQLLMREEFGPLGHPKYKDYAQDILQSSDLALGLLNDFLDLSKLKAGKWDIDPKPLDLNDLVRRTVHLMREMAAQKNIKLRSSLEENLPVVWSDERVFVQILINLLSNASKFTPEEGLIEVVTEQLSDGTVELRVKDTGLGMSTANLEKVLNPFQQADHGGSYQGSGLGLTIVKELSQLSGFQFNLKSELGVGTEVVLTLPVEV